MQLLEVDIEQVHSIEGELARATQSIAAVPAGDPRAAALRSEARALQLRAARLKQSAIDRAIAAYGIDASRLSVPVSYSPHGDMQEREGATYLDRDGTIRVEIGDEAFASAGVLGSTIGHEVEVHVNRQIGRGVQYPRSDEQGTMIQEVEAYDYELSSQARYRLTPDEVSVLRRRRAAFYRQLRWENRKRTDEGVYARW